MEITHRKVFMWWYFYQILLEYLYTIDIYHYLGQPNIINLVCLWAVFPPWLCPAWYVFLYFFKITNQCFSFFFMQRIPCPFKATTTPSLAQNMSRRGVLHFPWPPLPCPLPHSKCETEGFSLQCPWKGLEMHLTMKTGPNNASRCVVWAISMFFIYLFCIILTNYSYLGCREVGVCSDNKMGPNDAFRCVIWAISKFFSKFFHVFLC